MIEAFLVIILFIIGIYFGSFFTLATYRLPKKENITHKHSYCPNCNHKLGVFDLVPVFSYLFLGGKCRYCKNAIGNRYFLFEILTGIVFVLFGLSLKINIYDLSMKKILFISLSILYLASLFMLAGINKEQNKIQRSVLYYGIIVSCLYIVYSCTFHFENVYQYGIYLCIMILLVLWDTSYFQRTLHENNTILTIIFIGNMFIMTGAYITITSLILTILMMGFENMITGIASKRKTQKVVRKKENKPILFYMSVANIIMLIGSNFLINYMIK